MESNPAEGAHPRCAESSGTWRGERGEDLELSLVGVGQVDARSDGTTAHHSRLATDPDPCALARALQGLHLERSGAISQGRERVNPLVTGLRVDTQHRGVWAEASVVAARELTTSLRGRSRKVLHCGEDLVGNGVGEAEQHVLIERQAELHGASEIRLGCQRALKADQLLSDQGDEQGIRMCGAEEPEVVTEAALPKAKVDLSPRGGAERRQLAARQGVDATGPDVVVADQRPAAQPLPYQPRKCRRELVGGACADREQPGRVSASLVRGRVYVREPSCEPTADRAAHGGGVHPD